MPRGVMRPDTFSLVLDSLRPHIDAVKVGVLYHGGEPLLNKNFANMVASLKEVGIPFVKTVSNGMLLADAMLAGLVDAHLDAIEFSLDGSSPAENDFVRRNCEYETVVGNIKRLIDYKRMRGVDWPRVLISSTQFLTREGHACKDQQPEVPEHLRREFSGAYEGTIADYKVTWAMRWPHMEVPDSTYETYEDPFHSEPIHYCDLVDHTMTVRWNGEIVACCYDLTSRYVIGNVHEDDLATIWNNEKFLGLRKSIDTGRFIPLCASCNVVKPNTFLLLRPEAVRS